MKQTDQEQIRKGQEELEALKEIRGGEVLPFHKRLANDPQLLHAFTANFVACNRGENVIPRKYRELMIMIMGCARGVETTITVHGKNAVKEGASIEEVGEALRIALMICGVSAIIPASVLFEELEDK